MSKELTRIVNIEITSINKAPKGRTFSARDGCRAGIEMFLRDFIEDIDDLHVTVQDFEMEVKG